MSRWTLERKTRSEECDAGAVGYSWTGQMTSELGFTALLYLQGQRLGAVVVGGKALPLPC